MQEQEAAFAVTPEASLPIKYEAASRALAECRAIDEVKTWHDKAAALQAYGRMAQDKSLEVDAAEIRIRAERRLGEMLAEQKANGGLNCGAAERRANAVDHDDRVRKPTLADAGISKDLSSRAQKLAAVPAPEFEAEIGEWRERVSAENARVTSRLEAAGDRANIATPAPQPPGATAGFSSPDNDYTEEDALRDQIADLQQALSVAHAGSTAEDKQMAGMLIAELRAENKSLRSQLKVVTVSRDGLMIENRELKAQCKLYMRKLKQGA